MEDHHASMHHEWSHVGRKDIESSEDKEMGLFVAAAPSLDTMEQVSNWFIPDNLDLLSVMFAIDVVLHNPQDSL